MEKEELLWVKIHSELEGGEGATVTWVSRFQKENSWDFP